MPSSRAKLSAALEKPHGRSAVSPAHQSHVRRARPRAADALPKQQRDNAPPATVPTQHKPSTAHVAAAARFSIATMAVGASRAFVWLLECMILCSAQISSSEFIFQAEPYPQKPTRAYTVLTNDGLRITSMHIVSVPGHTSRGCNAPGRPKRSMTSSSLHSVRARRSHQRPRRCANISSLIRRVASLGFGRS